MIDTCVYAKVPPERAACIQPAVVIVVSNLRCPYSDIELLFCRVPASVDASLHHVSKSLLGHSGLISSGVLHTEGVRLASDIQAIGTHLAFVPRGLSLSFFFFTSCNESLH